MLSEPPDLDGEIQKFDIKCGLMWVLEGDGRFIVVKLEGERRLRAFMAREHCPDETESEASDGA